MNAEGLRAPGAQPGRLYGHLLHYFQTFGSATDDELAQHHPDYPIGSISKTRRRLVVDGQVRDSGTTRKTRWGHVAIWWEVVR